MKDLMNHKNCPLHDSKLEMATADRSFAWKRADDGDDTF